MRHLRPSKKRRLPRALITWVLAAAVVIGSVVTAVANSVDITVHDGDDVYTFSLIGADAESILARAKTEGMAALSDVDAYVLSDSDTVMTIQRNVRLSVDVDGSVHILIVPKEHMANITECAERNDDLSGHLIRAAVEIAKKEGLAGGFRLAANNGADACQTVGHLHLHLMGGKKLSEQMS